MLYLPMYLQVSPLISSGMVMQEGVSAPIRGKAAPGAEITVLFKGTTYRTQADSDGAWRLFLDSHVSGGPYTMEIAADLEKITIEDIYIGDVWICSGQSNMETPMQRLKDNFPEEWEAPVNSLIRQFKVPQEWEFSSPRKDLSGGAWAAASPETLGEFSGTAWFFARTLYEKRPMPVGLINAAWGGTPAEAWMSRDALAAFPEKIAQSKQYADSAWCNAITAQNTAVIKAWDNELTAADSGLTQAWQQPETDISAWEEITLPGNFAEAGRAQAGLNGFCGVLWLCREFEVSEAFALGESRLWLGTIVDADTVYLNGVEVGTTGYRYPPRKYPVPAGLLRAGKNRIVMRVVCCNGDGGVTRGKDFRLFSENGCIELGGIWKYRVGISVGSRPQEFFLQRLPTGLFNAMIAPILDYPCKGILWYQGESNDANSSEYAALLTALINDWRDKRHQALPKEGHDLPFLLVQLPIFGAPSENNESDSWPIIREAQYFALSLPATGIAAALDLGEWNDLHPLNKKDVGRRLALAAEQLIFQQKNTAPGPLLRGIEKRGEKLIVTFDRCGSGLTAAEQPHVSVIANGKISRLPAEIEGPDCLSIDISAVKNPKTLLYAWANNPRDRQLYNSDGLPALPFRVDISGLC